MDHFIADFKLNTALQWTYCDKKNIFIEKKYSHQFILSRYNILAYIIYLPQ